MEKSKLLVCVMCFVLGVTLITGCGKNNTTGKNSKLKAKCSAIECIKKIDVDNTVKEVNKIIGVDGVLTDEEHNFYEYDLGNDEKITLKYYSGTKATIVADFNRDDIADKKVDLSNVTDLRAKVRSGITYDKFKAEIGDVDGVLFEKSDLTNRYMWVSAKGGYVRASFGAKNNKCTFFSAYGDKK